MKHFLVIQNILLSWRYYLISMFYGLVLPGVVGGDVVRLGLGIKQHGMSKKAVLTLSIVFERTCGFVAILMIFTFMLFTVPPVFTQEKILVKSLYVLPVLIISLFITFFAILKVVPEKWFDNEALKNSLNRRFRQVFGMFRKIPSTTLSMLITLSILANFLDIVASYFLGVALSLNISLYLLLFIIPVTYIVTALPISLGGLGVREGVLTFFLVKVGVVASDAVIFAFLIYLNRTAVALIGGGLQLKDLQTRIFNFRQRF